MKRTTLPMILLATLVLLIQAGYAQKNSAKKYPSLLWEITGNGLKKPSYLFGTMHVSSKLAFHLSDSFYNAIQKVDAVALELNPEKWQGQMASLDQLKLNYTRYARATGNDYLNENSFAINNYEDELKTALSTEPAMVNGLLYRSYKAKEDFEEDTFLDLYIFQTGKKLGKRATGVEDYYETEKIILQAYADMANDKKKKVIDTDGESMGDIVEKLQDAYKRGDLDLMDSLDNITNQSAAFREKFMYRRNEIQAASIDTILKKSSLFVGVGAAHLAGEKGVIELLRKMGYRLRPVKMENRDAVRKESIDNIKVPVTFTTNASDDGFYKVSMPGPLYKWNEEYSNADRRQYADMANGCYYQVTRVRTHAAMMNQAEEDVRKKIDSLLYENIPGKILKKTLIKKNGYTGYDITNKTRRGDLQRYNIFITPFEVLIFKISGKENYVDGTEANQFFSSIVLKDESNIAKQFSPAQGGFSVQFPQEPAAYYNTGFSDGIGRWEYEANDKTNGNAYLVFKKSVYNFKFIEEDSFDLQLIETSFRSSDLFEYQLNRTMGYTQGYPCLDVKEKMKDSSIVTARFIIQGPHYYAVAVKSKDDKSAGQFIRSFKITAFKYNQNLQFTDTFLHFKAATPVIPLIDTGYRAASEKAAEDVATGGVYNAGYWPRKRFASFINDSTGEMVSVSVQTYPAYYTVKDPDKFWMNEINDSYDKDDLVLQSKTFFENSDGSKGYRFTLKDTGSSRIINRMLLLKDNYMYSMVTLGDTLTAPGSFITSFTSSFSPYVKAGGKDIFKSNLDSFFVNLFSEDSATRSKTRKMISDLYYGEKGLTPLMNAINNVAASDKDYFETKTKLIAELGYIKDSTKPVVVDFLTQLYKKVADTSLFQNEIIEALARHKTKKAILALKELVLQDPPVYDNEYEYSSLFGHFNDSLELAAYLYPEILQLATVTDYKEQVISLLTTLADSGLVKSTDYKSFFNNLLFDAKIEMKKQQGKDERKMEASKKNDETDYVEPVNYRYLNPNQKETLTDYALLLAPFYKQNENVQQLFGRMLTTKNNELKLNAAITLIKNNLPVPDSIFTELAANDRTRGSLYKELSAIKKLQFFPAKYKDQQDLARSFLLADKNYDKIDSIVFIDKQYAGFEHRRGTVYFFKYRVKKDDDWKIGISGLQPVDSTEVSGDSRLANMTDKKLKTDKPVNEQLQEQLKKTIFSLRNSSRHFYENQRYYFRYDDND